MQIPESIILLDIEKAFDSVDNSYLFQVLHHFNFGFITSKSTSTSINILDEVDLVNI